MENPSFVDDSPVVIEGLAMSAHAKDFHTLQQVFFIDAQVLLVPLSRMKTLTNPQAFFSRERATIGNSKIKWCLSPTRIKSCSLRDH
jgi:hypothetical protein